MSRSILLPLLGLGAIVLFGTTRAARPALEAPPPPPPPERVEITTPEPTLRVEPPAPPPAPTLRSEAEADSADADPAEADSALAIDESGPGSLAFEGPAADEDGP